MDFLSLFDPSEGSAGGGKQSGKKRHKELDTVKKKPEGTGKGRRRGRKSSGKSETLPEESSFLCEPHLGTEILVKDTSYIEHYFEINKRTDDTNTDDKQPKRRNSGRKSRRRKKNSPAKETTPSIQEDKNNLNNVTFKPKHCDENIGKNVNDLTIDNTEYKTAKRKSIDNEFKDKPVYNVIDKLEKVSLKNDMYLAGDFNTDDLESDFYYCSDENDEFIDDSTSDGEDSAEEAYGSLPPEPRFGNVEYKLRLSALCEKRFQHLVTQLKWRLRSGGGSCVYVVGVRDCGALVGLRPRALRASLQALRSMARALHAHIAHVTARRVATHRAVAEVYIKKLADPRQSVELRIAVMGANEAGKSTLIGVLTQGELDNGNGSARLNMFRHQHEVKTGMTSSLSHEILGFDAQGNVVNYGCSELMTAERIGERSAKLVSFLDLAGHSKYQRTTRHGLTGYSPHYAQLVISATAGITAMTEEHMGILLALQLPFSIVISKCELAPNAVKQLLDSLADTLGSYDKKPLLITDEHLARTCCAPHSLILDAIQPAHHARSHHDNSSVVPVFPVSCVRGAGLAALHAYLLALQPPPELHSTQHEHECCEFQIDEIFHVGDSSGPVLGGLLTKGQLFEGDKMLIGPLEDGSFRVVRVRSIYRNRVPSGCARAGQPASLGLQLHSIPVRPGMVLLSVPARYRAGGGTRPSWGGCAPFTCKRRDQLYNKICENKQTLTENNRKHSRRKDNNLLQDIANAEEGLIKDIEGNEVNIYKSDSEEESGHASDTDKGESGECVCENKVLLEDPDDPRGCMFFQACVHVLRHPTAMSPGFQCTIHVGSVRQTAIVQGIMSRNCELRSGETASALFRFVRCPEYLARGRQLLFTAGLGTRGTGRITQVFPYVP